MTLRGIVLTATLVAGGLVPLLAGQGTADAAAPSLCAPPADTVGPIATSVTFGRPSIDLDSGSRKQTVTVHASDASGAGAASGVGAVSALVLVGGFLRSPRLTLVSGTADAGVWRGSFTISKYARAHTASLGDLEVIDNAANEQDYSGGYSEYSGGPDALSEHPELNPTFTVTGTPATRPPGTPAGHLKAFTISPAHVDTRKSNRHVHFTARFSGRHPRAVYVVLNSDKSRPGRFVYLQSRLHEQHGVWRGRARLSRWLGKQKLDTTLYARYPSGLRPRSRDYDTQRLQHLHFSSRVSVVSGVDHSKPSLASVSLSPDPIDSTTGPERVTVTAKATDTGSGVQSILVDGDIHHGVNGVASGSYPFGGSGIGFDSDGDFQVTLKKSADGTWVGSTTIPRCVPSGTYKLTAEVRDYADNERDYPTKKLAKDHITSTVAVTSKHGDVQKPYVYSAATLGAQHELILNFSEGVQNVDTKTLTVFALAHRKTRYKTPSTVTGITCSDGTKSVDCSGADGLVTSAVLIVPSMRSGQTYGVYGNLHQVVPQLVDGNRNAFDWNDEAVEVRDS